MSAIEKYSPVTGEKLGEFHISTKEEVEAAVDEARAAFPKWRDTPLKERLRRLERITDVLEEDAEYFARKISEDTGKPLFEALTTDVALPPLYIDYYKDHAAEMLGRRKVSTPLLFPGKKSYIEHFPMGVIGVISPWNYPLQLAIVPAISALIAGNTVVIKPSEVTPITGEILREIFERAQLPEGTWHVCQGDGSTGAALVRADVDKIFFTGSVATGRKVMAEAAEKPIPVELELGGKDAMVVCHDANIDRAARAAVWGGLLNCGQTCISVERVLVVEEVYDEFLKKVKSHIRKIRVGGPDEEADMGPFIFPRQMDVIERHIEDAIERGAEVVVGGKRVDRKGDFFEPTLITGVTTEMDIYTEESFGPVIPVVKVRDEGHAIEYANDHHYGLTGSVWTQDIKRGMELASKMEAGQVMVNDVMQITGNPELPFGGVKASGIGRYHGEEGLLTFCHQKAVMVDRGWFNIEPFWFPYEGKYPQMLKVFRAIVSGNLAKMALPFLKLRSLTE